MTSPMVDPRGRLVTARAAAVLAVDDEPDIRLLIELLLGQEGYRVETAASGEEALSLIERATPDVVLLDIFLPGISGWQVAERLHAEGRLPGLPVLMLSAHADPAAPERAAALGCRGFVAKPFDPDTLVRAVQSVLTPPPATAT